MYAELEAQYQKLFRQRIENELKTRTEIKRHQLDYDDQLAIGFEEEHNVSPKSSRVSKGTSLRYT